MKRSTKDVKDFINSVTTHIAFFSFVIIYYNILFSTGAIYLIGEYVMSWAGGGGSNRLVLLVYIVFFAPVILSTVALFYFFADAYFQIIGGLNNKNVGFIESIIRIGTLIGVIVFVGVISIFVAFQSNEYLTSVGPSVRAALNDWFY